MDYNIIDSAGLYTQSGYLDFNFIMGFGYPYTIIVSLRGGGKTFGSLQWCVDEKKYFMYFRRNKNALKIITDPRYQIFKSLNRVRDWKIKATLEKEMLGHFLNEETGDEIGLAASLSTFGSIRSISLDDVDVLLFDEFIPQPDEIRKYDLFSAWLHADESITRNRVIDGRPEPRRILLANTDKIHSEILAGYGVLDTFLYMQESGTEMIEHSPDMLLVFPRSEKLAEEKENTALYRTTHGTEFHDVAVGNSFKIEDRGNIRKLPLREFVPISAVGGICIYRHKNMSCYLISRKVSGSPKRYENTDADHRRFLRNHSALWTAYLRKKVYFEDLSCQNLFMKLYNI